MLTFHTLDEAIALANDCEYGLTSSIFTTKLTNTMEAVNRLKFGETYVNREHFEAMQGFRRLAQVRHRRGRRQARADGVPADPCGLY